MIWILLGLGVERLWGFTGTFFGPGFFGAGFGHFVAISILSSWHELEGKIAYFF